MNESSHPGISVYVCHRCIPQGTHLPRQWTQDGIRVQVTVLPCSGKTDGQYLFHAIEAGAQGLLVVTCPKGECHLSQGNYRAEIRIRTVRRLLAEIGLEPERAELAHCAKNDDLKGLIHEAVNRFCALGKSPVGRSVFGEKSVIHHEDHEEHEGAITTVRRSREEKRVEVKSHDGKRNGFPGKTALRGAGPGR